MSKGIPSSLTFFSKLRWIDGTPLRLDPYRRELFTKALDTFGPDGLPEINFVVAGRGKKNYKSLDMLLAGFYCLLIRESPQGSDGFILSRVARQDGGISRMGRNPFV